MNIENLKKLSTYLKGPLKADFDMQNYHHDLNLDNTICGTIGCAAGHGPYAGIPKSEHESWTDYVTRAFGLGLYDDERLWCFASEWVNKDNSAIGAAKRIDYLLEHGAPSNWEQQMYSQSEPLGY